MPQPKKGYSLGSSPSHQGLMLRNLARSLFEHEKVRTTEAKAKLLRPYAERLITKAKKGTVHHRRQVLSDIQDRAVVHKLFADIGPRFSARNGGYTRILKLGPRDGDGAAMALIELVEEGAAVEVTGEEEAGGRRRVRRPGRRRAASGLPEDKPARPQAATAAAEGTPGAADVEAPDHVRAEEARAEADAEAAAAQAQELGAEEADAQDRPGAGGG